MTMPDLAESPKAPENLVAELRQLISEARRQAVSTVNAPRGLSIANSSGSVASNLTNRKP
jgi:hypothetical protein